MTKHVDPTVFNPLAAVAAEYIAHGPVVPITYMDKRPAQGVSWKGDAAPKSAADLTPYLKRRHNVALRLDNFLVVDVDGEEGLRSLKRLEAQLGGLPRTVTQKSGGGGKHIFFRVDTQTAEKLTTKQPDFPKVDFKAGPGHILVMAPSVHQSGGVYTLFGDLADAPPAPDALITLLSRRSTPMGISAGPAGREGERHSLLLRRGIQLHEQGWDLPSICEALWQYQSTFHDQWGEDEARGEIDGVITWLEGKANDRLFPKSATAMDVAVWLKPHILARLRYTNSGNWLLRSGNVFALVARDQVKALFVETVRPALHDYELWANNLTDEKAKKAAGVKLGQLKALKWTDKTIEAIASDPDFRVSGEDIDPPGVLNFKNGAYTIDGTPAPDAICTRQMRVNFNPDAREAERFSSFLSRTLAPEVASTVLDVLAHGLLRGEHSQQLWLFEGAPMTGKSTLVETMQYVVGGYAVTPNTALLFDKTLKNGAPDEDTLMLNGSAMAFFSEGPEGHALCPRKCKTITGGDTISARPLYGRPVSFANKAEIILTTNHETPLNVDDVGLKRRVKRIVFKNTVPVQERDPGLKVSLRAEAEAIVNLLLERARVVRDRGIIIAPEIEADTAAYFARQDILGQFIEACLIVRPDVKTTGRELYTAYHAWCVTQGISPAAMPKFYSRLKQRLQGIEEYPLNGSKAFRGVAAKST